ncbi:hypothetical protein EMIHUDRAFT_440447, partial [Emiliania huxleyi CCMP1516]
PRSPPRPRGQAALRGGVRQAAAAALPPRPRRRHRQPGRRPLGRRPRALRLGRSRGGAAAAARPRSGGGGGGFGSPRRRGGGGCLAAARAALAASHELEAGRSFVALLGDDSFEAALSSLLPLCAVPLLRLGLSGDVPRLPLAPPRSARGGDVPGSGRHRRRRRRLRAPRRRRVGGARRFGARIWPRKRRRRRR